MAFEVIDAWMANIQAHPERGVAGNKPKRAVDSCFDAEGKLIYAGEDVFKCALQSTDEAIGRDVYGTRKPSPEQKARLEEIFPQSVCDYAARRAGSSSKQ